MRAVFFCFFLKQLTHFHTLTHTLLFHQMGQRKKLPGAGRSSVSCLRTNQHGWKRCFVDDYNVIRMNLCLFVLDNTNLRMFVLQPDCSLFYPSYSLIPPLRD